jgi:hypothetical protein
MAVAAEFCELYENAAQVGSERFLRSLLQTLPRLHAAAVALPLPDDGDDIPDDDLDVQRSTEERQAVDFPVERLLGGLDWSAVEEHTQDSNANAVWLYDDLSDINADLQTGFRLLDAGRPEAEAVFEWYQLFWSHWGYHCASALRLVHFQVALY